MTVWMRLILMQRIVHRAVPLPSRQEAGLQILTSVGIILFIVGDQQGLVPARDGLLI